MNAASKRIGKPAAPVIARTTADDRCTHAHGLEALQWIGLVADAATAVEPSDLDLPSLAGGHCSEDPSHWVA